MRFPAFFRVFSALKGLPARRPCPLCLLPVLLGACFWPQGTENGNGGSAAADAALKSLADEPGNFLA